MPSPASEAANRLRLGLYAAFGALALAVLVQGSAQLALLLLLLSVVVAVAVVEPFAHTLRQRDSPPAEPLVEPPSAAATARHDPAAADSARVLAHLQQALEHAGRHSGYGFALLVTAVDTPAPDAAEALLQQVHQRLLLLLRPGDTLARLDPAGSVHAVVLEGVTSAERLATITERVLKELAEPYLLGSTPLRAQVGIGAVLHLAAVPPCATAGSPEELLRNARTALHEARHEARQEARQEARPEAQHSGRGHCGRWLLFEDSMQDRAQRAQAMQAELRRALAGDELLLQYQPLLDLRTHEVTGVEALLRWRHPEGGLRLPADFCDAAEACGLMPRVVDLVLQQACTQFVQWRLMLGAQAPPELTVNLSRTYLQRSGMADELAVLLQRCAMQPQWLQLSLKPGPAAPDTALLATLAQLRAMGIRLALDDFGSGPATLASLQQWPVDTLKINHSFVQQAQEHHRVLVEATARVAHTLGMLTVAEGIETESQSALMLALQCDRGQGLLFGRPMEAAALEDWLRAADAAGRLSALAGAL